MAAKLPVPGGEIPTLTALGREFGRGISAAKSWTQRDDWPEGIPRHPPWSKSLHLPSIRVLIQSLREPNNRNGRRGKGGEKPATLAEADLELKFQRTRRAKLLADEAEGRLHDKSGCERRMVRAIHAIKSEMQSIADSLPAVLATTPREQWPLLIRQRFDEMCGRFSRSVGAKEMEEKHGE